MHVELHFEQALPVLESEHRTPQVPEIGFEEARAEILLDGDVIEVFLALQQQPDQFPLLRLRQAERREIADLAALVHQPRLREVRIVVVDQPVLVENAVALRQFERLNVLEHVPEIVVVPVHLAAAADDVALLGIAGAVERAALDVPACRGW